MHTTQVNLQSFFARLRVETLGYARCVDVWARDIGSADASNIATFAAGAEATILGYIFSTAARFARALSRLKDFEPGSMDLPMLICLISMCMLPLTDLIRVMTGTRLMDVSPTTSWSRNFGGVLQIQPAYIYALKYCKFRSSSLAVVIRAVAVAVEIGRAHV